MNNITCDVCGKSIPIGYGHPSIPGFDFMVKTLDGDKLVFRLDSVKATCCFNTTNRHFCERCLFAAFVAGARLALEKHQETKV